MGTTGLEAIVRELADAEAIRDLARRYAHFVWQKDIPAAIDLFTEDGEMDTGDRPPIRGKQALLETYQSMLGDAEFQPFVHNHVIDLSGESATGEWKFRSRKLTMCYLVPLSEGWTKA
jgi:ketosteroid isomerase-like protein